MITRNLTKTENEEVILYLECHYSYETLIKSKEVFNIRVSDGVAKGSFNDNYWSFYNDRDWTGVNLHLDGKKYSSHIGKRYGISYLTMTNMLRCLVMFYYGNTVLDSISNNINVVKKFLERFGDEKFKLHEEDLYHIEEFLYFIGTDSKEVGNVICSIPTIKSHKSQPRKLKPLINYEAISREVKALYDNDYIDDKTFIKWFPIYFWVAITYRLPLRATEMLVTPFDCIREYGDKIQLCIRRTRLKENKKSVYYLVDNDFFIETRSVPNTAVIKNIKKYIELTKGHSRRFLFDYDDNRMINGMVSLAAFNRLLASFTDTFLIGNKKYEFAKYALHIDEFEHVTAGDSRPISLINLVYHGVTPDICSELANHHNMDTTAFYYTNLSEVIECSSVIQIQERFTTRRREFEEFCSSSHASNLPSIGFKGCSLDKEKLGIDYLKICMANHHTSNCIGCPNYSHTEEELEKYMEENRAELNNGVEELVNMLESCKCDDWNVSIKESIMLVQQYGSKYKIGTDIKAKEDFLEWVKSKNTQQIYC